jgi:hypothetical protein
MLPAQFRLPDESTEVSMQDFSSRMGKRLTQAKTCINTPSPIFPSFAV